MKSFCDDINFHGRLYNEKKNLKNILKDILKDRGVLIELLISCVVAFMRMMKNYGYRIDCQEYYNVPRRYFDGSLLFEGKIYFMTGLMVIFIEFMLLKYVEKKQNNKGLWILIGIAKIVFLIMLGTACSMIIMNSEEFDVLKNILESNWTAYVFCCACVYLGTYITIRSYKVNHKKQDESQNKKWGD